MNPKTRYLHVGCGSVILPDPFENLDVRKAPGVNHVSVAYPLKFSDNTFDLLYSSHVLEHFKRNETQNVLKEWVRVLKPGGTIRLSVPFLDNIIEIYQKSNDIQNVLGPLFGGQTYEKNFHYICFNEQLLTEFLIKAGCEAVHRWDYRRTSHSKYFDFSQATTLEIPISLNLEARKTIK